MRNPRPTSPAAPRRRTTSSHRSHNMSSHHVPERRCVGCGHTAPKASLARFVVETHGYGARLVRDPLGTRQGRGIYVCPTRACFARAVERRAIHRGARLHGAHLELDVALGDEFER